MENHPFRSGGNTVLSFSGVYPEMALPFMEGEGFIDCSDIGGTVCYCDPDAEEEILRRIATRRVESLHWIDSGDYHHVSALWLSRMSVPFDLLLLDNHPDMQEPSFGGILSCGGWVRESLIRYPLLRNVVIAGTDPSLSEECDGFGERVKVFDRDFLSENGTASLLSTILKGNLPLYISIDKDVLSEEFARTDWSQGDMTLETLLYILEKSIRGREIAGIDICGELPSHKGGNAEDMRINSVTDSALYQFFCVHL